MNLHDLRLRLRALWSPRQAERDVEDELQFHLECETRKLMASGHDGAEASRLARARFGSLPAAADGCRDARGLALVDELTRDGRYAWRVFARAPLASITIVATMALALGLVTVVFTFFNAFFYRVDQVREPDQLFAVKRIPSPGAVRNWLALTRADVAALRGETTLLDGVVAVRRGVASRIDGRPANGTLASGDFFQVLGTAAVYGRALLPEDDEQAQPVMVLSDPGWRRLFGADRAVLGRMVRVNGVPFHVIGIMPPSFRGLSLGAPDYWAPLSLAGQLRPALAARGANLEVEVIARLRPGITPQAAAAGLSSWAASQGVTRSAPAPTAWLTPRRGTVGEDAREALVVFTPLFAAFSLILLIACANVANLLLARGIARQRELGVRLSLGASRRRIVRQLLTESLLLAAAAAAAGLLVSRWLLDGAFAAALAAMPPEIAEQFPLTAPPADWRVFLFVAGAAVVSTLLFGVAPALQSTRLELVRTLRGELTRDGRPGRARGLLMGVQVCASTLLLVTAAVFLRAAVDSTRDSGSLRLTDTITLDVETEAVRPAILDALSSDPIVVSLAASSPGAASSPPSAFATAAGSGIRAGVGYRFASAAYFETIGIALRTGRLFAPGDSSVALASESAARRLWPDGGALGRSVTLEEVRDPGPGSTVGSRRTATIVGIVADVGSPTRAPLAEREVFYLPVLPGTAGTTLTLRVRGDVDTARQALTHKLVQIDPALDTLMSLRTAAGLETFILGSIFALALALGGIALCLTASGLFSLMSYVVAQRRHELGVRMALGATGRQVAAIMARQGSGPVLAGIAAGAVLAAGLATVLAALGASGNSGAPLPVFDPAAYVAAGGCIVLVCAAAAFGPALRAARIDPLDTLRRD